MRGVCSVAPELEPGETKAEALLKRRLERERRARAAAEATIEDKSRELFKANEELEQLLTGSIKMLADVLAMARPELFQKAGKVQRWARRVAPHLKIKRGWELDLAAMLYPLGMLSLPDDLTRKKIFNQYLTEDERNQIAESTRAAHDLLKNFPRMDAVADAVLYSGKGFDGSGYPYDDVKGRDIPEAARVLKILIDLSDIATGVDRKRDFKPLLAKREDYDLDILKVVYETLKIGSPSERGEGEALTLDPNALRPLDVVRSDIVDVNGALLLAAGSPLSEITIRRIKALCEADRMSGPIEVLRSQ